MIIADGYVYGRFWGGGSGLYRARTLKGHTKKELMNEVKNSEDIGEFDSGMGFEKVTAVIYRLKEEKYKNGWHMEKELDYIIEENRGTPEKEYLEFEEFVLNGQ